VLATFMSRSAIRGYGIFTPNLSSMFFVQARCE